MTSVGYYFQFSGLGWMLLLARMYFEWNSQLTADQLFVEPTKKTDNCVCIPLQMEPKTSHSIKIAIFFRTSIEFCCSLICCVFVCSMSIEMFDAWMGGK